MNWVFCHIYQAVVEVGDFLSAELSSIAWVSCCRRVYSLSPVQVFRVLVGCKSSGMTNYCVFNLISYFGMIMA